MTRTAFGHGLASLALAAALAGCGKYGPPVRSRRAPPATPAATQPAPPPAPEAQPAPPAPAPAPAPPESPDGSQPESQEPQP